MAGGSENWLPRPSLATFLPSFQLPSSLPSAGYTTRAVSRVVILLASAEGTSLRNLLQACSVSSGFDARLPLGRRLAEGRGEIFLDQQGIGGLCHVLRGSGPGAGDREGGAQEGGVIMRVIVIVLSA